MNDACFVSIFIKLTGSWAFMGGSVKLHDNYCLPRTTYSVVLVPRSIFGLFFAHISLALVSFGD
jgi:hypothetical protein